MNWTEVIAIMSFIMVVCVPIVGYFSVRSQMAKAGQEIERRVRDAMHDENELLTARLKRCESRQSLTVDLLLSQYHITLQFDGDTIILRNGSGTHVARIKED